MLIANTGTVQGDFTVISAAMAFRLEEFPREVLGAQADAQRSSLSGLLQGASQVVPFIGRATELSRLRSWRDAPGRLSVMLVFGPGGQGKTRLAAKLAHDSAAAGWTVMQAGHSSDPRPPRLAHDPEADHASVLVMVDYAERWPRLDLEQLVQHHLISRARRARVLLLGRPAGYWWKSLTHPLAKLGAEVSELPLGPLANTVAERKKAFTAARNRFAEILGVKDVAGLQPAGSLADDAYGLALTLHMTALVAVDAHRLGSSAPKDPRQLSSYLLRREYDHWQTMNENRRISTSPQTMARLVALGTLTQSLSHRDAVDLLLHVGLAGDRAEALSLLDDHESCYPVAGDAERVLGPLQPDRLGEDFLADLLPAPELGPAHRGDPWLVTVPAQLLASSSGAMPGYSAAVLSVLVETARRWEHVRRHYLVPLLLGRPRLALTAGGASLVTLASYADLELLTALEAILPHGRHVELDSGIAALTRRLTDYGLARTRDDGKRAKLYDELAGRLANAGLYEEALSATQNAIAIRRQLTLADPAAHEPMLANSLGNLGIDLWNVGQAADALDAMREAVRIYRSRVSAEPGAYEEDLAAELNNLAGSLIALARYADALPAATEAAAIFRRQAATHSGAMHELGTCLRNLAIILSKLGREEEALAAAQEAVQAYRRLVLVQPQVYEAELGDSLRNLSNRLSKLNRRKEALLAAEESVAISRRLVAAHPNAHEQGLAFALHSLATRLWDTGQRTRSLAVSEEAVQLQRKLAESSPDANAPGLGTVLNSLAGRLLELAMADEALVTAQEAVETWGRLAADPATVSRPQLERAIATRDRALSALRRAGEGST